MKKQLQLDTYRQTVIAEIISYARYRAGLDQADTEYQFSNTIDYLLKIQRLINRSYDRNTVDGINKLFKEYIIPERLDYLYKMVAKEVDAKYSSMYNTLTS